MFEGEIRCFFQFLWSLGHALGQAQLGNVLKHNILCFSSVYDHNILHFKCFRIMDLGVVKMGCFLIQIVVYGGSRC